MDRWVVTALRAVIVIGLAGSLVVQVVAAVLPFIDQAEDPAITPAALAVIVVLAILCMQVVAICVWRLLTLIGRGAVFSGASFKFVDAVIVALGVLAVLVFTVAVLARIANHNTPGDEVAPGVVALICGFSLVIGGVALVVYVLRALLAQAVALDSETKVLKSELDQVI